MSYAHTRIFLQNISVKLVKNQLFYIHCDRSSFKLLSSCFMTHSWVSYQFSQGICKMVILNLIYFALLKEGDCLVFKLKLVQMPDIVSLDGGNHKPSALESPISCATSNLTTGDWYYADGYLSASSKY